MEDGGGSLKTKYKIRPDVIDKPRKRGGITSGEQIASSLGLTTNTVLRARKKDGLQFSTGILPLYAAGISIPLGVDKEAA